MGTVTRINKREGKYVVMKKEQFDRWVRVGQIPVDESIILDDCFVVRTQDQFAEVCLYAYASALHSASMVLEDLGRTEKTEQLLEIADIAAQFADEARQRKGKLPT